MPHGLKRRQYTLSKPIKNSFSCTSCCLRTVSRQVVFNFTINHLSLAWISWNENCDGIYECRNACMHHMNACLHIHNWHIHIIPHLMSAVTSNACQTVTHIQLHSAVTAWIQQSCFEILPFLLVLPKTSAVNNNWHCGNKRFLTRSSHWKSGTHQTLKLALYDWTSDKRS